MQDVHETTGTRTRSRQNSGGAARRRPAMHDHEVEQEFVSEASGTPYGEDRLWGRIALIASALAVGLAIGAGVALLVAPQSGEGTRTDIARGARRAGSRARDAWEDLRDELAWARRRGPRHLGRSARRGRWEAEDALAAGRRTVGR
ncbi:MAG: YtxH domain-containing protein [Gemmatimonadaceae bacterium]